MTVIVHAFSSPQHSLEDIERWRQIPTAIVADVSEGKALIDPSIRPLMPPGQQPRLFGLAVTALCEPPDFGAVLHAIDLIKIGDVLVIDAQSDRETAMAGEILGGHLRRLGAAGVVCDGALRDVGELATWTDFSVFSRSITPRGPASAERGQVNAIVRIGGRDISPGDLIIGDDDGLVALTPNMIRTLIDSAEAKRDMEVKWQALLKSGKSVAGTFGLSSAKHLSSKT